MPQENSKKVTNGGSALGEAIGHYMELVVQKHIGDFVENYPCHFLKSTGYNPLTGKTSKKLLLYDNYCNGYDIDGVITNESMQPLVLLESKYIRYKRHNRDKGSWICNTHSAIRRRYRSIRASIAILAGNWSKTSLSMIRSFDTNVFLIDFSIISNLLKEKGIDFEWDEKDSAKAMEAWTKYDSLPEDEKYEIAEKMVVTIKNDLFNMLHDVLDDSTHGTLRHLTIELKTTKGETIVAEFESIDDAIAYLSNLSLDDLIDPTSFLSIFDIPQEED